MKMKTQIKWFIIGVVMSWLTWSVLSYCRSRPVNLTQKMPEAVKPFYEKDSTWVKSAIARHVGRFCLFAASDDKASAWLRLHDVPFPFVIVDSKGTNRLPESITLVGNKGQSISIDITDDGGFSKYAVSTGDLFDTNAVSVVDSDMDGQYDIRIGPGRRVDVYINSQWHQRISTNGQHFVEMNGVLKQITRTDKVWTLME
jgi:hypothetical protein